MGRKKTEQERAEELDQRRRQFIGLKGDDEIARTPAGIAIATVSFGDHVETFEVASPAYKSIIVARYFGRCQLPIPPSLLTGYIDWAKAFAQIAPRECRIFTRIAHENDSIFLQLDKSRVVKISPSGCETQNLSLTHPRFFWRMGMRPLCEPVYGGSIRKLLFPYLNLTKPSLVRYVAALLAFFYRGDKPTPTLKGRSGAGKTTAAKLGRMIVDPNEVNISGPPEKPQDFDVQMMNSAMLVIDNTEHAPPWLANAISRACTGGGARRRNLYTNNDETSSEINCTIWTTGLDDFSHRADYLSRALILRPAHPFQQFDPRRRSDDEMLRSFQADQPAILGAVLDLVSAGLRYADDVRPSSLPRMAGFYCWALACFRDIGWERRFDSSYRESLRDGTEITLRHPVAGAIRDLLSDENPWKGTISKLHETLTKRTVNLPRKWPRDYRSLGKQLRELAMDLEAIGIKVDQSSHDRSVTITRLTDHTKAAA